MAIISIDFENAAPEFWDAARTTTDCPPVFAPMLQVGGAREYRAGMMAQTTPRAHC